MDERLKKQLAFALEIDKEKNIFRQTHLSGHGRNENDAEHAWHMAIMAYVLREYSNEKIDVAKVMLMCLIHDIVAVSYTHLNQNLIVDPIHILIGMMMCDQILYPGRYILREPQLGKQLLRQSRTFLFL